ncbi:MAG: S8 family peptidase [Lachnospiraceae bacterium]|nr:S8 family peptidase [Lachnospiraceae bacterium]MCI9546577.1 S8 family peptidase [Lachnospiraceae bacterium]
MKDVSNLTGKGVGVAVIDTGIFPHVDFDNRIIAFQDIVYGKRQPYDDNGHGTHIAGILGGSGSASGGRCRGVAPECDFIGIKVLDRQGNGNKEHVLEAFQWLIENQERYHIRIVNISVGTTYHSSGDHRILIHGVDQVWDAGMVVVAAAGNQGPGPGTVTAPGSSRKVITVGASDMLSARHGSSGSGPTLECVCKPDIVAPGLQVLSCAPQKWGRLYVRKSGTSMSTPVISGAIARLLEYDPSLTNVEVKMLLRESAVDAGYPHNRQGWGRFDMQRFFQSYHRLYSLP